MVLIHGILPGYCVQKLNSHLNQVIYCDVSRLKIDLTEPSKHSNPVDGREHKWKKKQYDECKSDSIFKGTQALAERALGHVNPGRITVCPWFAKKVYATNWRTIPR
jgi:hypothetical protein